MKTSICIAAYNQPKALHTTLLSIYNQSPSVEFEVIVADDRPSDDAQLNVCRQFPVRYLRLTGEPGFRFNPATARNATARQARGQVLILQSADVFHGPNAVQRLTEELEQQRFLIATVWNVDNSGQSVGLRGYGPACEHLQLLTGQYNPRPLFFLGSVWREDFYAVGGYDEQLLGREDIYLADCLTHHDLNPCYTDVLGYHQDHDRPQHTTERRHAAAISYKERVTECLKTGRWLSASGPWPIEEGAIA